MYALFTQPAALSYPVVKPPGFELVKEAYQSEIDRIVSYYNNRIFASPGDHLLCRLLMTASVPLQYDITQFMEIVYARSPYIAKQFRITNENEYGIFHDGIFYGQGNQELLIANEDYFNPFEAARDWREQRPIKVLAHQISDLSLLLPDGRISSTGQGFCSLTINIPMLICMYRGFLLEQRAKIDQSDASVLGVTHFVHMYVLPGLLESHVDIVIMNRLRCMVKNIPLSLPLRKHVFNVIDYTPRLDKALYEIAKHLKNNKMNYFGYLTNIPSIFHENMQESLMMPFLANTRQAWWALNISRYEIISLLTTLGGEQGNKSNRTLVNSLKKTSRYLMRENMLSTMLPPMLYFDVAAMLQESLALD